MLAISKNKDRDRKRDAKRKPNVELDGTGVYGTASNKNIAGNSKGTGNLENVDQGVKRPANMKRPDQEESDEHYHG